MQINILLFVILFIGVYLVVTGLLPFTDAKVEKAIRSRGKRKKTSTQNIIDLLTPKFLPFISLELSVKNKLRQTLSNLGLSTTPELIYAKAYAMGVVGFFNVILITFLCLLFLSSSEYIIEPSFFLFIGFAGAILSAYLSYKKVFKDLYKELEGKRRAIEWELPQFSGTIYQQLHQNRNVGVKEILVSYNKISGKHLKMEIERTLNEIKTSSSNSEQALENMSRRINSGQVTQIAQGLIALSRGDNQYQYFQMITATFEKNREELIKQELQSRTTKLIPYNAFLFAGLAFMLIVAIGSNLIDAGSSFF